MPPPDDTDAATAAQELADLQRELAAVRAENEALVRKLGPSAAAMRTPGLAPPTGALADLRVSSGSYREPDREALVARTLAEVRSALAAERMDNEVLRSMQARLAPPSRVGAIVRIIFGVIVAAVISVLFVYSVQTRSLEVLIGAVLICALASGLVWGTTAVAPTDTNPKQPPLLPPPGV